MTLQTVACQSTGFTRQEYWSRLSFPSLRNLPNPGIESRSLTLWADSLPSEPPKEPIVRAINIDFFFPGLFIFKIFSNYLFAVAAAELLQSCPTVCDPTEGGSLPGPPVPGVLQARTLKWVAISFSNAWRWKVKVKSLSCVWPSATPWTAAYQAPPSLRFFQARVLELVAIAFSNYLFSSSLITVSWNHWISFCSYLLFPTVFFLRKRQTFSYVTEICQSISCWFFLERWQTFRKVKAKDSSFLVASLTSKAPEVKSLKVITLSFTTRKLKRNDFSWLSKKTSATGKIATLKSGETETSRDIGPEIRLPRAEFTEAINWLEH